MKKSIKKRKIKKYKRKNGKLKKENVINLKVKNSERAKYNHLKHIENASKRQYSSKPVR